MENEVVRMAVEALSWRDPDLELPTSEATILIEYFGGRVWCGFFKPKTGEWFDGQSGIQPRKTIRKWLPLPTPYACQQALADLKPLLADSPAEKCGECGGKKYIYVQANQGPGSGLSVRTLCHRCKGSGLEGE